jgi:exodeoxyribonuclease VII large subunit
LFDEEHKKKLPFLPGSIGVVTSSTGAVIKDILNVLDRRFSNIDIKIFPVAVQGENASKEIAGAIKNKRT